MACLPAWRVGFFTRLVGQKGVAFRDLKDHMNLNADKWVLGEDYSQAPTCATCLMSGHSKNSGKITHDPCRRISWTNRPPINFVVRD